MFSISDIVLGWTEVWSLLFPMYVMLLKRGADKALKPIRYYVILAFILNLIANLISNQKAIGLHLPWHQNVIIYNIHSVVRFVCFSCFFLMLKQQSYVTLKRMIPVCYLAFVIIDLTFFEHFFDEKKIDSNLFIGEAYLLLCNCLLYYLSKLNNENDGITSGADFFIVTGMCVFVVTNFFVYLFYEPMFIENRKLAENMWYVHNGAYLLMCLLFAKAFFTDSKKSLRQI